MDEQGARGRILIVDDNEDIRETLQHVLRWEGYAVDTAKNGLEALTAISRQTPDVVLLDLRLPVLDGPAVTRALRQSGLGLPIIAMSAAIEDRPLADEIGAIAYLHKPFRLDLLIRALQSALVDRRVAAGETHSAAS